ncbi:MAG TPA: hypothetical protein VH593_14320 [Ktedonobacteraceae bacterium]
MEEQIRELLTKAGYIENKNGSAGFDITVSPDRETAGIVYEPALYTFPTDQDRHAIAVAYQRVLAPHFETVLPDQSAVLMVYSTRREERP